MKKSLFFFFFLFAGLFYVNGQYVTNGSANFVGGNEYQLTPAVNGQSGSVWYQTKLNLNYNFSISSRVYLGTKDATGADGIAFVLQPLSVNAGTGGGGIGYLGITPSLDVEFDTWQNATDPPDDHLGINKNGSVTHDGNSLLLPFILPNIEDGAWHPAIFDWVAATKTFTVTFDGTPHTIVYDLIANIFGGNPFVYWGFTAGTGAANNDQRVRIDAVQFVEQITITGTVTDIHCPGTTGAVDITVTGGIPGYTYAWTGPNSFTSPSQDISGVPAGTYTVIVTDASNVSETKSFTINETPDVTRPTVYNCLGSTSSAGPDCRFQGSGGTFCIADNCPGSLSLKEEYFDQNNNKFLPDLFFNLAQGCYSLGAGRGFPIGNNTVVLTVTDASGNVSTTCSFTVVVVDDRSPVITCPAAASRNTDPGVCTYKVQGTEFNATATDCSPVTLSYTLSGATTGSGSSLANVILNKGTTTVTWTASDGINPSVSCTFTVTVTDNEKPKAFCKNATVTLANGTASITPNDINNGSSDNCGAVTLALSKSTFTCANIGSNTVTLTVTDTHGNTQTCTANVTVLGTVPSCTITAIPSNNVYTGGIPTNIYLGYGPQSVTLSVNATGGSPFTYAWVGTGTLSCTTCQAPVFAPTTAGTYIFTVTVTNINGCKTTCTITICVTDIRDGNDGKKVFVCHVPPGNPGNAHTLSISVNAVPAHLSGHTGDRLGKCEQVPCTSSFSLVNNATSRDNMISEIMTGAIGIAVLPNPNNGQFTLQLNNLQGSFAVVSIVDANGATIEKKNIQVSAKGNTMLFNLGSKASGLYYVKVVSAEGGVQTEKIVIQR